MNTAISVRLCKQCGKPIDPLKGRRDRLFCDANCKNKYHNTRTYEEEQELNRIMLILKENRRVLQKMFSRKDRDEISRERLLKAGFEFDFHTHFVISKLKRKTFIFCFDYGYHEESKDYFKIVRAFEQKEEGV